MQVLCLYEPRKFKPKVTQYTVTLCDCNHLAHVIVFFGKCKNLYFTLPLLLCFTFNLRAISKYKHPGAYIQRGDLTEDFLRYECQGLIFEGLIFGILRYACLTKILAATTKALKERPPQFFTE